MENYRKKILEEKLNHYFGNYFNPKKQEEILSQIGNLEISVSDFIEIYENIRKDVIKNSPEFMDLYSHTDTLLVSIKETIKGSEFSKEINKLIRKAL